jgi:hypothetical protein
MSENVIGGSLPYFFKAANSYVDTALSKIPNWDWREQGERLRSLDGGSPKDLFLRKHEKKINGTLGCFDRMLFREYLPIQSGWTIVLSCGLKIGIAHKNFQIALSV